MHDVRNRVGEGPGPTARKRLTDDTNRNMPTVTLTPVTCCLMNGYTSYTHQRDSGAVASLNWRNRIAPVGTVNIGNLSTFGDRLAFGGVVLRP